MTNAEKYTLYAGGAGLLLLLAWGMAKARPGQSLASSVAENLAAGAVGTAVDVVTGTAAGAVVGIGEAIGVPRTDMDKCRAAMAAGNNWDASLYCPLDVFTQWQWDGIKANAGAIFN